MNYQSTGMALPVSVPCARLSENFQNSGKKNSRIARLLQHLIVAVCGLAAFSSHPSLAQQASYYDFNALQANPSLTSATCSAKAAPPGVLFCLNNVGGGLSVIQDNTYTPTIDPNAVSGSAYALQLTQQSTQSQSSSVWYSAPQNVANGFTAWYAFKITPGSSPYGDGLAFVIQNSLGNATDSLTNTTEVGAGLAVSSTPGGSEGYAGIDNSLALEADTFANSFDPWDFSVGNYDDSHMALQSCGPGLANSPAHYTSNSVSPLVPTSCLVNLNGTYAIASRPNASSGAGTVTLADGHPHQVVVVYNGPNDSPANYIYVYLDPTFNPGTHTPVAGSTPIFSGPYNIANSINLNNGTAYVGFTAANGGSTEQHELMGFTFTPHNSGDANVCPSGATTPAPCSTTIPVTFDFSQGASIGLAQVVTQGATGLDFSLANAGTCTGTIAAAASCTLNVAFNPLAPGLRLGAVNLYDSSNTLLATKPVYGVGQGPAIAFDPGTQTTVPVSGLHYNVGEAVDAAGNLYVADYAAGKIVKITSGGTQSTVPAPGVTAPIGVAVDGAGDLLIADLNLAHAVKITPAGLQTTVGTGLGYPIGIAVDGGGNVYIADQSANSVVEVTPAGVQSVVPFTGLNQPWGVAVDAGGDVFVADGGNNRVVKVASGGTQSTVPAIGLNRPYGVAVDAAGDVFIADGFANQRVVEVTPGGSQTIVGTGLNFPSGVAVDGAGNVFIADQGLGQVFKVNRAQTPSLSFGTTSVGSTSSDSPQSIAVQNIGNASLNATSPGLVVGSNFTQAANLGTLADCTSSFSLAPSAECNLSISFTPLSAGVLSGAAVFYDNTLNDPASIQSVNLSGAASLPAQSLTVSGAGTGSGSVTSNPPGIQSCSIVNGSATGTCSGSYPGGSTVSLQEVPAAGYTFAGWGAACSSFTNQPTCSVTLIASANVTASFAVSTTYLLSVTAAGTGSGTVTDNQSQVTCSRSNGSVTGICAASYTGGSTVTFTASPSGSSIFVGWGGACSSAGISTTCTVTVNSALNVSASFVAPGSAQSATLKPITAGIVYGQGGSFNSNATNNGGVTATTLGNSQGMVADSYGNLYLSDGANNRVLFYPAGSTTATRVYGQGGSFASNAANNGGLSADSLNNPQGIAVDGSGNVYVADEYNNRVLFYPAGSTTATRVYGQGGSFASNAANSGGVSANSMDMPMGIALDLSGNLYVADYGNSRVLFYPAGSTTATQVYGQGGSFTTASPNKGGISADSLNQAQAVALDASGDLYVADIYNNRVLFYPYSGTTATQVYGQPGFTTNSANNGGVSARALNNPLALAVDSTGNLYVVDRSNNRVLFYPFGSTIATRVYGQSNDFTTALENNGGVTANSLKQPWGIALDPAGSLYIADYGNNRVLAYGSFSNVNVCPAGATGPAPCNKTVTLAYSPTTATSLGVTQVVTQGAIGLDFTLASGGTCTGAIAAGTSCTINAEFAPLAPGLRTGAITLYDNTGNPVASTLLYGTGQAPMAAFGFDSASLISTGSLALSRPTGAAVDAAGNLFISDNNNRRVVKVAANGTTSTVGVGLNYPQGLAVDGAGDLFIADNNLNQVVEVPVGCTTAACQKVVGTGLRAQLGVAVDGVGNVFIADFTGNLVAEVPANGGPQTVVYNSPSGLHPVGLAVDATGDLFIALFADTAPGKVLEIPAGCGSSSCQITVGTGFSEPEAVAVDAAGDVFVADENSTIMEVPAGCTTSGCQSLVSGLLAYGVALDAKGDVIIPELNGNKVTFIDRSQLSSQTFALTNVGSISTDSPKVVSIQNVGNQTLTGTTIPPGTNFTAAGSCGSFHLAPGAPCAETFSFAPQSTGFFAATASFSDNTLNLSPGVVMQQFNMTGIGGLNGQAVTAAVPNVVGFTQPAAVSTLVDAGLVAGSVSTAPSSIVPSGSVIASNPAAGTQVSLGSAVKLQISSGPGQVPAPNPLTLLNNYFVTGDYASAGVTLRTAPVVNGFVTGTINIPASSGPGVAGVPTGADLIDGFLYWTTLEKSASPSGTGATFLGYPISGQQIGSDLPYTDGSVTGALRVYRANVNTYFQNIASGIRIGSGSFTVSLPAGSTNGVALVEGAGLVVIYRVLSSSYPLKAVVIYDGAAIPPAATTQNVQGFYDAAGGANGTANITTLFVGPTGWNNVSSNSALGAPDQYNAPLNGGAAYGAVILSTPVNNPDNDGILGAWKAGPPAADFHGGQPGYYDVKTGGWVGLPGAKAGQKDLFVQLDYMCGALLSNGACDPNKENLYPSPDSLGNDPLAMVQTAFAQSGVTLHLQIGNIVPEDTCNDSPGQPCQFPGEAGVIGWKNSLEFSKVWPRNFSSCVGGGDCSPRFPYGQKDSYHYVLFGHSLAIPAWNSRYGTLTSINSVAGGQTTITTADRGTGINACPARITLSGILSNPGLNGIYTSTSCPDSMTILVSTPGSLSNWTWSYATNSPAEPVIGITSGTVTSISGYSDLGGADSAVTLGLWETAPNQDMSKRATVIAGTLFHEIGHTLGLSHGGLYYDTNGSYVPTFEANCKPNYQSIMNYLFQLDGVGPNAAIAFSNQTLNSQALSPLMQSSLGSVTNLVDTTGRPATFPTSSWYTSIAPSSTASPATRHCDGLPLTGDTGYRVNGSVAPITPAWSNGQNITFDGQSYSTLRGFNDLANIDLRQVGATGGQFASLSSVLAFGSSTTPLNIAPGGSVAVGAGGTVTLGAGGSITVPGGSVTIPTGGTISGGGTITLGGGGNVTLGAGGTAVLGVGNSGGSIGLASGGNVTLGAGGTITLGAGGTVTLGAGGNVTLGAGGTIALIGGGTVTIPPTGGSYTIPAGGGTVTLGGGGNITLGGGGNVTLGAGGNITLGAGGTVTLGGGGNVTLGAGGTVTLGGGGNVTLGGGGNVTLGGGGTITLGGGGNVTLGAGGNVTLGAGGTVTLGGGGNITLGGGGNVTLGAGGTVTLGAGGNVTLGAGGTVTLGGGGNVTLGAGGTITLGGGGNVTLGAGGTVTLGAGGGQINGVQEPAGSYFVNSGGTVTLGAGGNVTLGAGGNVTLGGGGTVTLGAGGNITLGGGGTVTLGAGGNVTLGAGGNVTLGAGGNVTLGAGGNITLGGGGNVTLGGGGAASTELDYTTANSVVRPPPAATYSIQPSAIQVNWTAPIFGVVQTYTISRSAIDPPSTTLGPPVVIGSVSGVNGFPPVTTFYDTNPDTSATQVVYTITTTLAPDADTNSQRQSAPSPPAVLTVDQTIVLGALPSSASIATPSITVSATAESNNAPNMQLVSFTAAGPCSAATSQIDPNGVSSARVTLNSTGSCTITASQTGDSTSVQSGTAYNAANPVSGTFMIVPANSNTTAQTINFPQLPTVQYGSQPVLVSASATSGLPITVSASGPCKNSATNNLIAITGVGTCTVTASAPSGTAGGSTYTAGSVTQSFNISPAVLTVAAGNLTTSYGQQIPSVAGDYTITGYVNGESSAVLNNTAPAISTTATSTSAPGTYPITVSTGNLAALNYSFLYVSGMLTVNKANANITVTPYSVTYDGKSHSAAATATGVGGVNLITDLTLNSTHASAATYSSDSWSFTDPTGNYNNVATTTITDTISPANLIITASSGSMVYGGPVLPITPSYSGFVNGDTASILTPQPVCSTMATSTAQVGAYPSNCSGAADSNYNITYVPGSVSVAQATTTISVASSVNPSTYMQLVTFTATVTPQFSGTIPTGTVAFNDTSNGVTTVLCSNAALSVVNGQAQATCSSTSLGDKYPNSITAVYAGDTRFFLGSSSASLAQTVNPAPNASLNLLSVSFGNQNVNTTSSPTAVLLSNTGDAALNFNSSISITPSTDFAETDNCGTSLAAGATCTITIRFTPISTGIRTAILQITDNDDDATNAQQTIALTGSGLSTITGSSLFTDALFATANGCGSIVGSGGSTVDSFNSTLGFTSSHMLSGGNVGTNGNISLNGSKTIIYGSGAVDSLTIGGCSKTSTTGLSNNGGSQLTGGLVPLQGPVTYPAPPAPSPAPPTTTQNISGSCGTVAGCTNTGSKTVTLAPGQYGNLTLSGGTTAHLGKGVYNLNSLALSGQSSLYIDTVPVVLNLAGASLSGSTPALDASGGSIQNPTANPANLQINYAGSRGINMSGGSGSYATLYAPGALVNMSGGSDFFGSIIAGTITNSGGTAVHYDTSLPVIKGGNYIWLSAVANNLQGLPQGTNPAQVKLYLTDSSISYTVNGTLVTAPVPNAVVTFNSTSATSPTTNYDAANSRWSTSIPASKLTGNTFVTGVEIPVPSGGFPTGIQNISWSAAYSTDTPGITLQWQWGAAVYNNSFGTVYNTAGSTNALGVNPEDGSADLYGTDPAGTPEAYKTGVLFGATGGGLTNYTGFLSNGAGVVPTIAPMSVSPSSLTFAQPPGTTSNAMTAVLTNNDSAPHMISGISIAGANPADFTATNTCPGSLAAGAGCTISVTFNPSTTGIRTAKVVISDDAKNTPQTLYLSGTAQ